MRWRHRSMEGSMIPYYILGSLLTVTAVLFVTWLLMNDKDDWS